MTDTYPCVAGLTWPSVCHDQLTNIDLYWQWISLPPEVTVASMNLCPSGLLDFKDIPAPLQILISEYNIPAWERENDNTMLSARLSFENGVLLILSFMDKHAGNSFLKVLPSQILEWLHCRQARYRCIPVISNGTLGLGAVHSLIFTLLLMVWQGNPRSDYGACTKLLWGSLSDRSSGDLGSPSSNVFRVPGDNTPP